MPTFREDLKLGTKVPLIKTDDISDRAVTNDKLADGAVSGTKLRRELIEDLAAEFAKNIPVLTDEDIDRIMALDG